MSKGHSPAPSLEDVIYAIHPLDLTLGQISPFDVKPQYGYPLRDSY